MSERKVLNKYYPPDFDPSKIPRSKVARNKTFTIRLMAPCNMRCTTCGEYIYKGRKFNARKEDVEDMDHLGLRIYRFYIKCTACLSEISFRTDPANTDYILEAGATRNFEALAKAEKQAELERLAYQEELKTNPMKLLEERTEASKNEMERMEALEELRELNKREVKVNYDSLLGTYDKIRAQEEEQKLKEDEDFIKSVFGKTKDEERIKRIVDDDDDGEDDDEPIIKKSKLDQRANKKVTDILAPSSSEKKEVWEKSIGSLNSSSTKSVLVVLKKKKPQKNEEEKPSSSSSNKSSNLGSLSLLGAYSDSDQSE